MQPFQQKGITIGRGAFAGWGDGEPGMIRAVWCLLRHLRPEKVIETGVARGFTSRFILEALERNSAGHLWSIDLPPVRAPELHAQVGAAAPSSAPSLVLCQGNEPTAPPEITPTARRNFLLGRGNSCRR
jgi:hypothetical protein